MIDKYMTDSDEIGLELAYESIDIRGQSVTIVRAIDRETDTAIYFQSDSGAMTAAQLETDSADSQNS